MPTYTPHLSLAKPADTEKVSVSVFNSNFDTLDAVVHALKYTYETKNTTETINSKTVRWHIWKYEDGRMEIESDPVTYTVPITTAWAGGWFRSNISMQWVFPETFTSIFSSECKATETSELVHEVPVLNGSVGSSARTNSGWKTALYYTAPDSKTATIKVRCKVSGKWK